MYDTGMIQNELNKRGWYQKNLAEAAGLNPATISRLMLTKRARPKTINAIATALKVDPAELRR